LVFINGKSWHGGSRAAERSRFAAPNAQRSKREASGNNALLGAMINGRAS
jgi:hypothetical protein